MATEKKMEAGEGKAGMATEPVPEMAELLKTVEALRAELQTLKRATAPRVQTPGVYSAPAGTPTIPAPVQTVITQYEALKRALQLPIPAWVFPGSTPVGSRPAGAAPTDSAPVPS